MLSCKGLLFRCLKAGFSDDAERDGGVTLLGFASFAASLCAATCARRVPCAAFHRHDLFGIFLFLFRLDFGGGPFPAVAPHVDGAASGERIFVLVNRGGAVVFAAVEIGVFRHVACRELPFLLRGQAVFGLAIAILLRQPFAVGDGVVVGDVHDRMFVLALRILAVKPFFRGLVLRLLQEFGIFFIRDGGVGDVDVLSCADERLIAVAAFAGAWTEARIREAGHGLLDAVFAVAKHFIDNHLHFIDLGLVPGSPFQFLQLGFLACDDGVVVLFDLFAKSRLVLFRRIAAVGGNQPFCLFVEFRAFAFDGCTESELLGAFLFFGLLRISRNCH